MGEILKYTVFIFTIIFLNQRAFSQVAINNDGSSPDASAILDISSTEAGLLIPRMTEAQRDAIGSPAEGLMIFQTDGAKGFHYFDGSSWLFVGDVSDLWTRDGVNAYTYLTNTGDNVGIGLSNPADKLDVNGSIIVRGYRIFMPGEGGENRIESYTNLRLYADNDNDNSAAYSNVSFHTDGTEKMRITYNGRVGIGTTSPSALLHVVGNLYVGGNSDNANLIYLNGAGYNANIGIDATGMKIGHNSGSRDLTLLTNSIERITVKNTGEVDIGTTSPNMTLSVTGYATASNYFSTIPLWQAGSNYSMSNTSNQDLSNCESGIEPSLYEPNGNIEVKLVIRVTASTASDTRFQLRVHDGTTEDYPIVYDDSWTWASTASGWVVTSPWKTMNLGTNAFEVHLTGWVADGSAQFNSAYLLVRPAQP